MTEIVDDGDEFTELVDGDFGRIDLVTKGANGIPFLIAKSADGAGGLLPPELVRSLVGDREGTEVAKERDDVTISGSPAAVMKMIHEAAQRASASTPESEGGTAMDDVTKADAPDVEVTDLVADAPGGSTAESVPGSADWEAMDADTALNLIGVLGRVKGALGWLAGRESMEAVSGDGDPSDIDSVFDLEDAATQVDCIIRRLAGFAATETLEADVAAEVGEVVGDVTKADLEGLAVPVSVIETFSPVVKAGRVLSSANEAAIRSASDSLQKVLASLPAPIADDQPVAKEQEETTVEETVEKAVAGLAAVAAAGAAGAEQLEVLAEAVEKAKGDPQVAVYDASGNLVGTIDPKDLSPIASATPPAGGDADAPADDSAAVDATGDAPAPVTDGDLTPAPAADAGVPADAAAAAAAPAAEDDQAAVTKSADEVLKEMLDARVEEALKDHPVVKALADRVTHLEAPAPPRVLSNGQLPPAHQMRGQDHGAATTPYEVAVAKADELRARLNSATTVDEREAIAKEMNEGAAAALEVIRLRSQTDRTR